MIYCTVFITAIFSAVLHFFKETKALAFPFFLSLFAVILFINGFKYASIDYFSYLDLYEKTTFKDFRFPFYTTSYGTTGMEFLWASLSSFFKNVGLPFEFWIFFIALISTSIKFYFYNKYLEYYLVAVVVYLSFLFAIDLGQLRNGLAGALLLLAINPILKKEPLKFTFIVLLAANIQVIGWVALPLYIIYWQFLKRPKVFLFAFIVLFFISTIGGVVNLIVNFPFFPELVSLKLKAYSLRGIEARSTALSYTGTVFLVLFIFYYKNKERIFSMSKPISVLGVFFMYGLMLSYFFTGIHTASARSLDLLVLPAFIFIYTFLFQYYKKPGNRLLILMVGFLFLSLNFYKISLSESGFAPYQNILFN